MRIILQACEASLPRQGAEPADAGETRPQASDATKVQRMHIPCIAPS
jgi:hypothetical protein